MSFIEGLKIYFKLTSTWFALCCIIFFFWGDYMHEQVHVQIYRSYGIESRIEMFSHFPDAVTIAEEPCPTDSCRLAHNLNEVVTYNLESLLAILFLGFYLLLMHKDFELLEKINYYE
jgi:hypothetical protein